MTKASRKFRKAFSAFGIEAEYMIVDKDSLDVRPVSDEILAELNNGVLIDEVELDKVAWSNELVCHVLEIKCSPPAKSLDLLDETFHQSILKISALLGKKNCCLLSTAMHPWMSPEKETKLWPHGQKEIYNKYNEIFGCRGHGWSNLQSVHINLPFADEEEFGKLHGAVRAVLPLIPYLAASSPFFEGRKGPGADNRLGFYEKNQVKVPSVAGKVIPEKVYTFKAYQDLLQDIYNDIAPFDPEKILQHQWLNSRGAIVKFDVQAIEIRVMDIQESPYMDMSLIFFITEAVRFLYHSSSMGTIQDLPIELLKEIYDRAKDYDQFNLPQAYTSVFGLGSSDVQTFTFSLFEKIKSAIPERYHFGLEVVLKDGNLSKRMLKIQPDGSLKNFYQEIQNCLVKNQPLLAS